MSEQAVVRTHDYRIHKRGWGHDIHYTPLPHDRLRAAGWGHGLKPGDFLLLSTSAGGETRYCVGDDLYYSFDPPDYWRATLEFAPRSDDDR
jgi:hypothetical protein